MNAVLHRPAHYIWLQFDDSDDTTSLLSDETPLLHDDDLFDATRTQAGRSLPSGRKPIAIIRLGGK